MGADKYALLFPLIMFKIKGKASQRRVLQHLNTPYKHIPQETAS